MDPPASSPVSAACAHLDNSFGPHAGECRGGFDFNLFFEETILTILPAGLILLVSLPRVWFMWRKAKKLTSGSHLATVKVVCTFPGLALLFVSTRVPLILTNHNLTVHLGCAGCPSTCSAGPLVKAPFPRPNPDHPGRCCPHLCFLSCPLAAVLR